tara:strand:+ start:1105 stop:1986 length:882 start_codon:yes stop_codon:yes gene_type:complete
MKYAFFPGCVSRGGCPELYPAAVEVCSRLGLELEEIVGASCTGAGVLQEKNQKLGDTLNARTFAMAEGMGMPIMTICSTCQGTMAQAHDRLKVDSYRSEINEILSEEGLEYKGEVIIKHLLWIMVEDIGLDEVKKLIKVPLSTMKVAAFYGCYIIRPTGVLGFDEHPEREDSLERVIEALGAELVEFPGKTKCCGFPILTINEKNSVKMVANHTLDAKERGADAMVTPCPLCHLNLDGFQPKASAQKETNIDLPVLHLPQMVGLAMGLDPKSMGLNKHIVPTAKLVSKVKINA